MTIGTAHEHYEGRKAVNSKGQRKYTRVFKVEGDSKNDTAFDAGSATGLPSIGDAFPDDANAFCKTIAVTIAPGGGYKHWLVTCDYDDTYQIEQITPVNDELVITWSSELFQSPAWKDKDLKGVVNSAGDPFNPPAMRDDHRTVCRITKNYTNIPTFVLTYPNTVNDQAFTVDGVLVAKRYAKVSNVSVGGVERRNGVAFRSLTIELQIRNTEWDLSILDAGFRQIVNTTERERITNENGTDITEPALLDGAGVKVDDPDTDGAVFLDYRVYTEQNFIGTIPGCT